MPGSVVAKIDASVEHDWRGSKGFRVFEIDSHRLGVSSYEKDNPGCCGKNGEQVANDRLFGNLYRSVIRSVGFGHDHAVAHAGYVSGFDNKRVAIDGNESCVFGVHGYGYSSGFLCGCSSFGLGDGDEFSSSGEHFEVA